MYAPKHAPMFAERMRGSFALLLLMPLACAAAGAARAQDEAPVPAQRQIHFESGASLGNFHFFAHDDNQALHPVGVEYEMQWIRSVLKGGLETVSEVLPVVVLSQPARYSAATGAPTSPARTHYGAGFAPAGLRLIWRSPDVLQPYFGFKAGGARFKSPLYRGGSHMHFIAEVSAGVEKALSNRWGLRAGFSDFHLANAGTAGPKAADFLYSNGGVSYRF